MTVFVNKSISNHLNALEKEESTEYYSKAQQD